MIGSIVSGVDELVLTRLLCNSYVGKYQNRVEAELAYDAAAVREAIRMQTIPERMPPRRMRIRPCGKHYTIEVNI